MATEYERKRLENIKRNDEMMAALKVHAKSSLLSAATKRPRKDQSTKSFKKKKKNKSEEPVVIRRQSLRTRGLNPDSGGLRYDFRNFPKRIPPPHSWPSLTPSRRLATLPFDAAFAGGGSCTQFVDAILDIAKKSRRGILVKEETGSVNVCKDEYDESPVVSTYCSTRNSARLSNAVVKKEEPCFSSDHVKGEVFHSDIQVRPEKIELDLGSLSLEPCNVGRVVPERILVVKFLPCKDVKMIAAGDKHGNVGFWNLDCEDEDDGIYLFTPHTAPVSSLVFQQNSFSKVISSSYDGHIRLMDVEKMVFDLVHSTDEAIFSLSQRPNDEQSLFFGEGSGMLNIWDLRAGKSLFCWDLHGHRINSIDFNPQNPHVMATSSTDSTACLWDLRNMRAKKPETLTTVKHDRAVHSAYFSPSGLSLATTSVDNHVGILSGANFEDTSMIYHNNSTNRWISSFRGVWGWDDSHIFVGNLSKKIDVISPELKRTVMELHDPLMTTIPCRIHCHPLNVGMLAGSAAGGQVYVWTTK